MAIENLWGLIEMNAFGSTPVAILKEQATYLEQQTDGLLRGEIETVNTNSGSLVHTFILVAPLLNEYRYTLMRLAHPVTLYPIRLKDVSSDQSYEIPDEQTLVEVLKSILQSAQVKKVIQALLIQSKS